LFLAPLARAADTDIIYPRSSPESASPTPATKPAANGNSLVLMVAVIAAGGGAYYLWKQRRHGGFKLNKVSQKLVLDETKSLGNRQFIVVASYENQKFLLGVCPGRIELLTRLDEKNSAATPTS
jgi:flagellar protein FliO/FliZ